MLQTHERSKPIVDDRKLNFLTLDPGIYHLCSCGLSANSPFCDIADQRENCNPVTFELTQSKQVLIDSSGNHTRNTPFCDNIHAENSQY